MKNCYMQIFVFLMVLGQLIILSDKELHLMTSNPEQISLPPPPLSHHNSYIAFHIYHISDDIRWTLTMAYHLEVWTQKHNFIAVLFHEKLV